MVRVVVRVVARSVRRTGRRVGAVPGWLVKASALALGACGAAVVGALVLAGHAGATSVLTATIGGPSSGSSAASLQSTTCAEAASTLEGDAAAGTVPTLAIGPSGLVSFTASQLAVATDATGGTSSCSTLTLEGTTTLLGQSAEILVVGRWPSATSTSPSFTILLRYANVGLSSLVGATTPGPGATLSTALVGVTTSSGGTALSASDLPGTAQGFLSSLGGGSFDVAASGVSFRGVLSGTGSLATGLSDLGVSPGGVVLEGSLTGSVSALGVSAPPTASAQLDLAASVQPSLVTPSWLSLTGPLTLSVTGSSGGSWSASAAGAATVDLPETPAVPVAATISITKAGSAVELGLDVSLGTVPDPFGQSWLTLDSADVSGTIGSGGITADLAATATVSGDTYTVTAALGSASGLGLELKTSATVSALGLAGDLGLGTPPAGTPDLSLGGLDVYLEVPSSGPVTVAATGTATLAIGTSSYSADVLVRGQSGASGGLLVAARPAQSLTLGQLLGTSVSPDMTLPSLAVVFSTSAVSEASSALDPPTLAYFSELFCPSGTSSCAFTLDVPAGVGVSASVTLPGSIEGALCTLVGQPSSSCASLLTGPVTIDGQIPLFGGTTTSLTVNLPTINVDSGPVQQVAVHLAIAESGGTFSFSVGGTLVLFAPGGGGAATCPQALQGQLPSGDVCLDLSVDGSLGFSSGTASISLTGQLTSGSSTTGWVLPSPVSWLTVDDLTVQLGVTSAGGGGLTLGARGAVVVGSTDLALAVDLEVTADAPWVDLLGFTVASHAGVSLQDLVSLYEEVSGKTVPPGSLPPLALRNLYLSYSSVSDPGLCLTPGLYVSGDLVLTNSSATPVGTDVPTGQASDCTPPSRSSVCSADSSSCLASVFLSISHSGIEGSGYVTGWSAGPLSFAPTDLSFTLDSSEVQVDISGGGTLLDPVLYSTEGAGAPVWASGSLTLDVGTKKLLLDGSVTIGQLSGSIQGSGSLDLSDPGFSVTDWFDQAQAFFTGAGQTITSGADTVASTTSAWYSTYVAPGAESLVGDVGGAFAALDQPQPPAWQAVLGAYQDVSSKIDGVNAALDSAGLGSLDISTTTIFEDALDGLSFNAVQLCLFDKCVTIVPGFSVPGLCSTDPGLTGTPVCTAPFSQVVSAAQHQFADPSVASQLASVGLVEPPGASPGSMVTTIHALDPPGPSSVTCAMATGDYATASESPTTLQVDSLGTSVTFAGPKPTTLGSTARTTTNQQALSQDTFDGLYSGQNVGSCSAEPPGPAVPAVTLSLDRSWIDEGGSVTASGYVEAGNVGQVTVDWGDGTSPSTVAVTNGQYSADHVYADETATGGGHSPYTVSVSAAGAATVTGRVAVLDAPVTVASLAPSSPSVDVMSPLTLRGTLAGVEAGEPATAVVSWGDGTPDSTVTVAADGSFSASHTYDKLVPSGQPAAVEPIAVHVAEGDGTAASASSAVTVHDVAPQATSLVPTTGASVTAGTVFTHAGTPTAWTSQTLDVSPEAVLSFSTDWADGSPPSTTTVAAPTGAPAGVAGSATSGWYPYSSPPGGVTHTFSTACFDPVQTTVTDADTLSAPVLTTPVVVTAPLGATAEGAGYWHEQLAAALGHDRGQTLGAAALTCYLAIAQHLSSQLGTQPSLPAALGVLEPRLGHLPAVGRASSLLRRELLTSLLDCANGTADWTEPIGAGGASYASLVAGADAALSSGRLPAIEGALQALRRIG